MDAMKKNLKHYVCNDPAWIERYKSKVFGCMYFKKIKTAVKFFEFFASILMRV